MTEAQFNQLVLNQTTESQVRSILGEPLADQITPDYKVLVYTEKVPTLAEYVYFTGDKLVKKSRFVGAENKKLQEYIDKYGVPEKSIKQFKDSGDLYYIIHIWSTKGTTVQTQGANNDSLVIRVQEYNPIPLKNYFEVWDKNLKDNKEITLLSISGDTMQNLTTFTAIPKIIEPQKIMNSWPWILLGLGIVVFTLGLVRFIRNRRKKIQ